MSNRPYRNWTDAELREYLDAIERMADEGGNGEIQKLLAMIEAEIHEREFED